MFPNGITNIISPIILLSLLIAFPIIGAKAGWKKAAYWGGGNLLFYIIGTLIYRFAGEAMAKALAPKMLELFTKSWHFTGATVEMITPIIRSWLGPVVFIAIFLLGNLILVINYYTWFKKVAGVSRTDYAKKIVKMSKKFGETPKLDKNDPKVIKYKVTNEDLVQVQSKKYKGLNGVVGCFGLLALMAPSTIALSQAALYTTTSQATRYDLYYQKPLRQIGKISYNVLDGINTKATWFSFYGGQTTGDDFNSLMSILRIGTNLTSKWNYNGTYKWINPSNSTGELEAIPANWTNSLTVFIYCYANSLARLIKQIIVLNSQPEGQTALIEQEAKNLELAANICSKAWGHISDSIDSDIQGFFASEKFLKIIPSIITAQGEPLTDAYVGKLNENNVLDNLLVAFSSGTGAKVEVYVRNVKIEIQAPTRIELSQTKHLEPLNNLAINAFNTTQLTDKTELVKAITKLNSMLYIFQD